MKVERLDNFLKHGYGSVLRQYLIDGFRFGFRINFVGEHAVSECSNLKSVLSHPDITATKIRKECDAGRLVGPFTTPPFRNFRTSPLGLVPKKDPNEYRLIHHSTFPEGSSFLTVALRADIHLLGMPPNLLSALVGVVSWQKPT